MKHSLSRVLGRTVSSDAADTRFAQVTCFAAGAVMLGVSVWKVTRLDLTEAQFFLGMLLSLCVPLLLVIIGLLLPIARAGKQRPE